MSRLIRIALAAGVATLTAGSLAGPALAADGNNRSDIFFGAGSDTTYDLMSRLDVLYNGTAGCATNAPSGQSTPLNGVCVGPQGAPAPDIRNENYDHNIAASYFPTGSSTGVSQLRQQGLAGVNQIGYARSSRGPQASDGQGLRFVAFARDALTWVSFPNVAGSNSRGVTNLTISQLRAIFVQCTIKDWRQLKDPSFTLPADYTGTGASDQPIVVYSANGGSGTRATWDGFVGGNSTSCIPAALKDDNRDNGERVVFENDAKPIANSPDAKNAIFFYSYGRYEQNGGEGSIKGQIEGVTATPASLQADAATPFPFARNVYNVYRVAASATAPASNAAVLDYVKEDTGFICKPNDQHAVDPLNGVNYGLLVERTIRSAGFVAINPGTIGGGVAGSSKCRVVPVPSAS